MYEYEDPLDVRNCCRHEVRGTAKRRLASATAFGRPFGLGFFLAVDELMNPLLGLTPAPQAFPWQAHARGLAGHVVFGVTNHVVLEGLDRVA